MGELLVYRASAGSGKTFTLAVEYIKLLIDSPSNYRHILAVTFTNKATAEMKSRILSQLYGIAYSLPESEAYFNRIKNDLNKDESIIRKNAKLALKQILHNYSFFHVETIDSFFQMVMRNLAHELQLSTNLNVELNSNEAIDEAVDHMLELLNEHSETIHWILDSINERIDENSTWDISDKLKTFARNLFNENYQRHKTEIEATLAQKGFIQEYKKTLDELITKEKERMMSYATTFFDSLETTPYTIEDFPYGNKGGISFFLKIQQGIYSEDMLTKRMQQFMEDSLNWVNKKQQQTDRDAIRSMVVTEWQPLMIATNEARIKADRLINSCMAIKSHLNDLRLLNIIHSTLSELNKKANRFLLADTPRLLNEIICDADASFIFEKIGTQFQHIMIDEFQDTSRMQWKNFKSLLTECLANNKNSLIVGDIKQSIYRWRSGDWTILGNLKKELPQGIDIRYESLATNRRSEGNIIEFNNHIFKEIISFAKAKEELDIDADAIELAYEDVEQKVMESKRGKGAVYIELFNTKKPEADDYRQRTYQRLVETVQALINKGVAMKNIAMLVRVKRHIPDIAAYFAEKLPEVPVVSAEAFRLDASEGVNLVINAMYYLLNQENKQALLQLVDSYQNKIKNANLPIQELCTQEDLASMLPPSFVGKINQLTMLPLYELIERIIELFDIGDLKEQTAYLFFFLDEVMNYLREKQSDIVTFLNYWEEILAAKTIPAGEVNGIRIHSIHASKGLEFNTVLIPFCDWAIEKTGDILWNEPNEEPFNNLSITPVDFAKRLSNSIYTNEYKNERLQQWIDNINLLYVAFTRAKTNLYVWGKFAPSAKNGVPYSTISELLYHVLNGPQENDNTEDFLKEYGELCITQQRESKHSENPFETRPADVAITMQSSSSPIEFRQSRKSQQFIRQTDDKTAEYISQGLLLHNLFSQIRTQADVEPVLEQFENNGYIGSSTRRQQIRALINKGFENEQVQSWFSKDWQVLNECKILQPKGSKSENKRPDRVIVKSNQVIVIDFKFGQPKDEYTNQVSEYMHLLQNMGYKNIQGYLWYVYTNQIVSINA